MMYLKLILALSSVSWSACFTVLPARPTTTTTITRQQQQQQQSTSSSSALAVSFAVDLEDETRYRQLMNKARECAFSDTANPAEAKQYLHDILHMESRCVTGTLADDFCDNVDQVADIVVNLREKAADQDAIDMKRASLVPVIFPLVAATAFSLIVLSTIDRGTGAGAGAVPFQMQEWGWAVRDGYLDNMIAHYFRNGGL